MSGAWIHARALIMFLACDCRVQKWAIHDLPELLTALLLLGPDSPVHPSHVCRAVAVW